MAKWANAKNNLVRDRAESVINRRYKTICDKPQRDLKTESVDDFLKRGGRIIKLPPK